MFLSSTAASWGSAEREVTINLDELAIPNFYLSELEVPFLETEVWRTINMLPADKAPGPDGFIGKFYKACWPIIKADVMAAVSAVWSRKMGSLEILHSDYITLMPKKKMPQY